MSLKNMGFSVRFLMSVTFRLQHNSAEKLSLTVGGTNKISKDPVTSKKNIELYNYMPLFSRTY